MWTETAYELSGEVLATVVPWVKLNYVTSV